MNIEGSNVNQVRLRMGTNAMGIGYEMRTTLLATDATANFSSSPTYIPSRLNVRSGNNWWGNFVAQDQIGQGAYCQEECTVVQVSHNGTAILGDKYSVQVEILPQLDPCVGCTISCDGDFSSASAAGCTANPGGANCVTVTITGVNTALSSLCTTTGSANKVRIDLLTQTGIKCSESCIEQFIIDGNYLTSVRNPGIAYDKWLSNGPNAQFDLRYLEPWGTTSFTIEIMAVNDQFSVF